MYTVYSLDWYSHHYTQSLVIHLVSVSAAASMQQSVCYMIISVELIFLDHQVECWMYMCICSVIIVNCSIYYWGQFGHLHLILSNRIHTKCSRKNAFRSSLVVINKVILQMLCFIIVTWLEMCFSANLCMQFSKSLTLQMKLGVYFMCMPMYNHV